MHPYSCRLGFKQVYLVLVAVFDGWPQGWRPPHPLCVSLSLCPSLKRCCRPAGA